MANQWYYKHSGEKCGPITDRELKARAELGEILPDDLLWKEGMTDWQPARRLKGLFLAPKPEPSRSAAESATAVAPPTNQPANSNPNETSSPAGTDPTSSSATESRKRKYRVTGTSCTDGMRQAVIVEAGSRREAAEAATADGLTVREVELDDGSPLSPYSRKPKKPARWNVAAGVFVLIFAFCMMASLNFFAFGLALDDTLRDMKISSDMRLVVFGAASFLYAVAAAVVGKLIQKANFGIKCVYCLVVGVIPGMFLLMGWEAIREGSAK